MSLHPSGHINFKITSPSRKLLEKSGAERLIIGCNMADSARQLVWSGIPSDIPEQERRQIFLDRFYGTGHKARI